MRSFEHLCTCQPAAQVSFVNFLPFRMLYDSRTGQCIGPCVPPHCSLAACRTVCSSSVCAGTVCIAARQHANGVASQEEEAFNYFFFLSSHSSTSTHTLHRKLKKRERAKAQSSRKKENGRPRRSSRRRHRSKDEQSSAMPPRKKGQRPHSERRSPRKQLCADLQPGRLRGTGAPLTRTGTGQDL